MAHVMTPGVVDSVTIPAAPAAPQLATPAAAAALAAEVATVTGQLPTSSVQETNPTTGRLFTEDEIAAARRQEKDKLYPQLSALEDRLRVFEAEREERDRQAQVLADAEAQVRREREDAELSSRDLVLKKEDEWKQTFNTAQQEWETKFNALQAESEARAALLERERSFQELETYKSRRIQEESENLMPELLHLIAGNTQEEIDSSIANVAATTSAIVANIEASLPATPQRPKGISPVGAIPTGPLENSMEQQTLTQADIANMSMQDYAQVRDRLLAAGSRRR